MNILLLQVLPQVPKDFYKVGEAFALLLPADKEPPS